MSGLVKQIAVRFTAVFLFVLLLCSCTTPVQISQTGTLDALPADGGSLPEIDGWMRYKNKYADWLGIKYFNKTLREPINIIIIDAHSQTREQAVSKLLKACRNAGYEEEYGHSSGYEGLIDNQEYGQIPNNRHMAFANKDFFLTNNHGRIIGPALYNNEYVFIAGFSTEKPTIFKGFKHMFVSFTKARNDFSIKLDSGGVYKMRGTADLHNVLNTQYSTTADHDGKAIVFEAQK